MLQSQHLTVVSCWVDMLSREPSELDFNLLSRLKAVNTAVYLILFRHTEIVNNSFALSIIGSYHLLKKIFSVAIHVLIFLWNRVYLSYHELKKIIKVEAVLRFEKAHSLRKMLQCGGETSTYNMSQSNRLDRQERAVWTKLT